MSLELPDNVDDGIANFSVTHTELLAPGQNYLKDAGQVIRNLPNPFANFNQDLANSNLAWSKIPRVQSVIQGGLMRRFEDYLKAQVSSPGNALGWAVVAGVIVAVVIGSGKKTRGR